MSCGNTKCNNCTCGASEVNPCGLLVNTSPCEKAEITQNWHSLRLLINWACNLKVTDKVLKCVGLIPNIGGYIHPNDGCPTLVEEENGCKWIVFSTDTQVKIEQPVPCYKECIEVPEQKVVRFEDLALPQSTFEIPVTSGLEFSEISWVNANGRSLKLNGTPHGYSFDATDPTKIIITTTEAHGDEINPCFLYVEYKCIKKISLLCE